MAAKKKMPNNPFERDDEEDDDEEEEEEEREMTEEKKEQRARSVYIRQHVCYGGVAFVISGTGHPCIHAQARVMVPQ